MTVAACSEESRARLVDWALRLAYCGYAALLTAVMLTSDPWELFGSAGDDVGDFVKAELRDYHQHFLAYAVLGGLSAAVGRRWPWLWAGLALGHGLATELLQAYVPHRVTSAVDFLADCLGVLLGFALVRVGLSRLGRKPPTT